jgi:hypothetical protein
LKNLDQRETWLSEPRVDEEIDALQKNLRERHVILSSL